MLVVVDIIILLYRHFIKHRHLKDSTIMGAGKEEREHKYHCTNKQPSITTRLQTFTKDGLPTPQPFTSSAFNHSTHPLANLIQQQQKLFWCFIVDMQRCQFLLCREGCSHILRPISIEHRCSSASTILFVVIKVTRCTTCVYGLGAADG